jgi:hypothetical protein
MPVYTKQISKNIRLELIHYYPICKDRGANLDIINFSKFHIFKYQIIDKNNYFDIHDDPIYSGTYEKYYCMELKMPYPLLKNIKFMSTNSKLYEINPYLFK